MIKKVIKRDGSIVNFDSERIYKSIKKATQVTGEKVNIGEVTDCIVETLNNSMDSDDQIPDIETISDLTIKTLGMKGFLKTAEEFKTYSNQRTRVRESKSELIKTIHKIGIETDRDNANVGNNFSAKLLRIGSEANKCHVLLQVIPKDLAKLHENGDIYDQDLDSYNLTINCLHIPTKRILDRGFNPGYGMIRKPNSIETAAILSCILLQSSQNDMFGGQSHPNFDNDLSEYVMLSRKKETARSLIHRYVENNYLYTKTALISDMVEEDVTNWDESSIEKVKEITSDTDLFNSYLRRYDGLTTPASSGNIEKGLIELTESIIKKHKRIKEFIKDIPSSSDKEYWQELIQKIDNGIFDKETGITCPVSGMQLKAMVEPIVYRSIRQAMQTVVYNLNTMHSRAGAQVPFSTVNIGIPNNPDAAMLCEVFLEEYAKGLGNGEQPIFPNIIFRVKSGVNRNPEDQYYYLFKKACEVAAKRMNPTFMNLDSNYYKPFYDKGIVGAIMGCRTAVCANVNGKEGPEGRGNIAPATINLPRIGIMAMRQFPQPEMEEERINFFWELLNDRLGLCVKKLITRYKNLKRLKVKDIPFSIGQGLMQGNEDMQLNPNDSIDPVLRQGTYGVGFIGLAETLTALIGEHQGQSEKAQKLGLEIVRRIREYTDKTTKKTGLNFSCYATPAEGLCGKLVKIDRDKFGTIKGITDKDYYTNSYHIPVSFKISIMNKLRLEAPYQYMCNAGCISYIEFDGEPTGETMRKIITKTFTEYPDMNYMAGNFHKRTCRDCGHEIYDDNTTCPHCGSNRIQGVSRVTGYLSLDERFGVGKAAERKDRVTHDL